MTEAQRRWPEIPRLMLTAFCTKEVAVAAMNDGRGFALLEKPCSPEAIKDAITSAIEVHERLLACWLGVHDDTEERLLSLPYLDAKRKYLESFDLRYARAALKTHGSATAASEAQQVSRRTLQRIISRLSEKVNVREGSSQTR